MMKMVRVLATSFDQGGVNAISPVIRRLQSSGIEVVTLGHGKDGNESYFKGQKEIDYKTLDTYNLDDLDPRSMEEIFTREIPDIVLTGTSVPNEKEGPYLLEHLAIRQANINRVPSVSVLDMWVAYEARFSGLDERERLNFLPDRIAIMDEVAEKAMVKEGFLKDILAITGNPYFDGHEDYRMRFGSPRDKITVHRNLGVPGDHYLITFFSQPINYVYPDNKLGYNEETALRELLDATRSIKDRLLPFTVLVKGHPDAEKEDLSGVVAEYHDLSVILHTKRYNPKLVILASDVVVTMFSTVAVETAYLSTTTPIISLQPGLVGEDKLVTNGLGLSHLVRYREELLGGGVLESALFGEPSEEMTRKREEFMESNDGKAADRVTDLVLSMT